MSYLLFPGRHLLNTCFQAEYLKQILSVSPQQMKGLLPGKEIPTERVNELVFAITSANQSNSRYNPIPFHARAISVDRFARELKMPVRHRIFGIPHYGHVTSFADFTVKEIHDQSEGEIRLTPSNCLVLCSTPEVISQYQALGFSILTCEQTHPGAAVPMDLIRALAESGDWNIPSLRNAISESSLSLFQDFPEIPRRVIRLYRDPLTNQEGSLTDGRNYNTYARGMNDILRLKYLDIAPAIRPGRIVDEGCADGGLLAELAGDFPDSDLYGIDLSAEFAHRFEERRRSGDFGGTYAHFYLRNLLEPLFENESIDTTLCNSTLHEIWSYADGESSVRSYLKMKFQQLRPGGRLLIRDVVGPENVNAPVLLKCESSDGLALSEQDAALCPQRDSTFLDSLSTQSRFHLFCQDFLRGRPSRRNLFPSKPNLGVTGCYEVSLGLAAEFLSKKDYTDNWVSEMNEQFCFWSFSQWKQVLSETGFRIIEREGGAHSRVYCNPWIVENRYQEKVELFSIREPRTALEFPPTNMVLVAEKPAQ